MSSHSSSHQQQNKFQRNLKIFKFLTVLFLILSIVAGIYAFNTDTQINKAYSKTYPLLDPNRQFQDKKDLIINIQPLRDYLKSLPEKNKDWAEMSIYFEVLNTGANITVNPDLDVWPASLSKLPISMVAIKKVEKGEWTLDKKFKMDIEYVDEQEIPKRVENIGKDFELSFVLERLLLESDNTAYRMILKQLTKAEIDSLTYVVGLEQLFNNDSKISAKEYIRLLRVLYNAAYLNEEHSNYLLELLDRSKFDGFLSFGIPSNIPFAHKWGRNDLNNVYADSGILYIPNRPVLISVMIQGKSGDVTSDRKKAEALMREIGEKVYVYINNF
jgi:beta-lactamase class A